MNERVFIVGRTDADQTISAFLRLRLQLSWSETKTLVASGVVRVASQKVTDPAFRLKLGKKIEIMAPPPKTVKPEPKPKAKPNSANEQSTRSKENQYNGPLPVILYSDDSIVVVDKPPGLTTMRHADEADEFGEHGKQFLPETLVDMLPAMLGRPGKKLRSVHRIDKDTSGLVIFARSQIAQDHLDVQFREHRTERRYQALVRGIPKNGRIETIIARNRGDYGRRGASPTGEGKSAITKVKVLQKFNGFALVECQLETGRTHQVRIHLGEIGTPICGEHIYDRPLNGSPYPDTSGAKRTMLHAITLGVVHPVTQEKLSWESSPPADFESLLMKLQEEV